MSEDREILQSNKQPNLEQHSADTDEKEASTRREMIRRYGTYALVAGPLLLFASKAHAIISRP